MEKRYIIDLDIYAKYKKSPDIVFVSGDTYVNVLEINLKSKNEAVDLTDIDAVTITFKKPDKNVVIGSCTILDAIRGKVEYVLGTQEIAYPGIVQAEVQLFKEAKRLTTALFEFTARRELDTGEWQESETYLPILTELQKGMHDTRVTNFVIAPHNAVNKERADLVLTGVPADDVAAINQAITDLHTSRESTDIAVRVDFLGGTIDLGTGQITVGYDNFHLYGNGVKITSAIEADATVSITGSNVVLNGFNIAGLQVGLFNTGENCTITNNTCSSVNFMGLSNTGENCIITNNICSSVNSIGLANTRENCIITNNICSSDSSNGLDNRGTNCTITNNICSGANNGLYNSGTNCTITNNICSGVNNGLRNTTEDTTNKCIIIGNICINGGISVKSGTCLPATQQAMADVNTGTIEIRP